MRELTFMVLELLVKDPKKKYSILEIAKVLGKNYKSIHPVVQRMVKQNAIKKQRIGHTDFCSLDLNGNISLLCFAEAIRAMKFLKKNKELKIIAGDIIEKMKTPFYTLLIFGSYAKGTQTKSSDVDVLMITDNDEKAEEAERIVHGISRLASKSLHFISMKYSDFLDMLKSTDVNVANQAVGNHIIFNGSEQYYKMLAIANVV